jgi:hypothetical protein
MSARSQIARREPTLNAPAAHLAPVIKARVRLAARTARVRRDAPCAPVVEDAVIGQDGQRLTDVARQFLGHGDLRLMSCVVVRLISFFSHRIALTEPSASTKSPAGILLHHGLPGAFALDASSRSAARPLIVFTSGQTGQRRKRS